MRGIVPARLNLTKPAFLPPFVTLLPPTRDIIDKGADEALRPAVMHVS